MQIETKPSSKKKLADMPDMPTSKFIFIFICKNEVILDEKNFLPSESVNDLESGSYSWNKIAINITSKV